MFRVERPRGRQAPVLVEVPHAGVLIPEEVRSQLVVDPGEAWRDADAYVDELFRAAPTRGATLLVAEVSRYVVDLNRDPGDVDGFAVEGAPCGLSPAPRGVIWRERSDGRAVLSRTLTRGEFDARMEAYYHPYHRALAGELARLKSLFGRVVLVAAHSMPSVGRGADGAALVRRADVVPGTRGRATAAPALIDAVEGHFRAAGLSVRHDDPYRGGATTARWGRPSQGHHAIQVELNRALYMDERSGARGRDGLRWLSSLCESLVERLVDVTVRAL